ncbi:NAD-dependent epimerase/dehydratase family protein [Jidongwangia harbinensis]|uniref:NAD-dependent epimerase/dehydratase family protein n=1 Tax=Jidongwangia harbinensis TaxID=2878561 RepID=UPI001CD98217|nr:NAD-dependent epimerase/dehydratase family protein [Jidongwangia harbinensis]MCA2211321.1 GDP-mannose 4,6-dehydratase [Jidongwangia harbinensis]
MAPRVLVTGGAGYLGGHVVLRLCAAGARVGVLDSFVTGTRANLEPAIQLGLRTDDVLVGDIRDRQLPHRVAAWDPEVVIHLAAQPSVAASVRDPLLDAEVNVLGTLNVLTAATRAAVRKVVFASSGGTVYGSLPPRLARATEQTAHRPESPYGLSKATADRYLRLHERLHGLRFTSLALGNVYGPRLDGGRPANVVGGFVFALLAGHRPVLHGDGRQTRDFVHVTDVARAFESACDRGDGTFLNIGTGVETSVLRLLRIVAGAAGAGREPPVEHRAAPPGEARRVCLDITAAGTHLGWRPRLRLADGVARLVAEVRGLPAAAAGG